MPRRKKVTPEVEVEPVIEDRVVLYDLKEPLLIKTSVLKKERLPRGCVCSTLFRSGESWTIVKRG